MTKWTRPEYVPLIDLIAAKTSYVVSEQVWDLGRRTIYDESLLPLIRQNVRRTVEVQVYSAFISGAHFVPLRYDSQIVYLYNKNRSENG